MNNIITFQNGFVPHIPMFKKITLDDEHYDKLTSSIIRLINKQEVKLKRKLTDDEKIRLFRKPFMQVAGETVMEQFLGIDFVDYDNVSDIKIPHINKITGSKSVDVSTFSFGFLPLVYGRTYRKTIFICMVSKREYYICGLGAPAVINGYSKSDLVISDRLRMGGKAAFYGFDQLKQLSASTSEFLKIIA
jgi:hypothetical protein